MSLLEDARALLATGPLCDACLGRPVADRSHGLSNAERGRALRTAVALADDDPYEGPPADCWVCEGLCDRFDAIADTVLDALDGTDLYTYQVGTRLPPLLEENERLLRADAGLDPGAGEPLKTEVNREVGRRVGAALGADVDFDRPDVQVLLDLEGAGDDLEPEVEVQRNSLSVYGRYRKLERGLPQTEWDTYEESVEELVAPSLLAAFRGTEAVFHGAGREDVDARMEGTGRPFVLEIKQPRRRDADLASLETQVNDETAGRVEVEGLAFVTHEMIERVKEHPATKTYRARVALTDAIESEDLADAIAALTDETVRQRTPNRVAHRRADRVRERDILEIDASLESPRTVVLEVRTEGGLYVKELVSGDEGRTEPSLAERLGTDATVEALDVVAVTGVGEPFLTDAFRRERSGEPVSASA